MKEYPILFNTEMVKAILAGNKTQTRRLKAPWKVGDLLYVREAWSLCRKNETVPGEYTFPWKGNPNAFVVVYKAGGVNVHPDHPEWGKTIWKPSIHMEKRAARLWLKVTEVRTEKLQDITFNDAYDEGVNPLLVAGLDVDIEGDFWSAGVRTVIKAFADLWDSCAKPGFRWSDNPDVIVTKFERVQE